MAEPGTHDLAAHRAAMTEIAALIQDRGIVPDQLLDEVAAVYETWKAQAPDRSLLASTKLMLWRYLQEKHGDSAAISDDHDRTVRAALCLTEEEGAYPPSELLAWALAMLPKKSY